MWKGLVLAGILLSACARTPDATDMAATAAASTPAAPAAMPVGDPIEGLRVATRVGCNGCHGRDGGGRKLWSDEGKYHLASPNLTERRALYDDAGIRTLLREGKTHDGHRLFGMPIVMFGQLSDREVADITAWLRSLPAIATPDASVTWLSDEVRAQVQAGTFPEQVDWRANPAVHPPRTPPTASLALGQHLAMTSCTECHGPELNGWGHEGDPPPLIVAKAYSLDNFVRLMTTGITASGKVSATGLMTEMGRERFPAMTNAEIAALKQYLDAR